MMRLSASKLPLRVETVARGLPSGGNTAVNSAAMLRALKDRKYEQVLDEYADMVEANIEPDSVMLNALVEAKASGGAADAIAAKLQAAQAAHTNLHDLVEMQKTVKYRDSSALFTPATPAHRRAEAQVAALAAEMAMLGGA